jgi:hypothetical protein
MTLTNQANPLMRLFEFATGMLTAHISTRATKRHDRSVFTDTTYELGALGLVVAWWVVVYRFEILKLVYFTPLVGHSLGTWIWFCSAAPLFGLVVWTFARSNGLLARLMASPAMVHLGEISFAFYMIHMIVIRVIDFEGSPLLITGTTAMVLCLVASLAAAELLYQLVEMPSKDGLNALLNGRPVECTSKFGAAIGKVLFKPLTGIAALALLAVVGFVHQNSLAKHQQARVREIVGKSSVAFKRVDFVNASQLQGCLLVIDNDSISIELAWQAADQSSLKRRTIYLMDQNLQPLKTEKISWPVHHRASASGVVYDLIEFDRSEFPELHRIMLAWEHNDGERAMLAKDGNDSPHDMLELHCVDPELAAIDTLSMPPGKLRSLIEQMPQDQSYVRLGDNATLCGYECSAHPDGGLSVNLAWKLKPALTERRVLNFLDENTSVVGNYGDVNMLQFVRREMKGAEESLYLDELLIAPDKYQGASTITLGLWDEQAKRMVRIENGETLANGQRLIIGRLNAPD